MTIIMGDYMLGKIILSTIVAGLFAGLILAGIQHVRLTPLILQAEAYETPEGAAIAELNKPCVENMPGMKMCSDDGRPLIVHEHSADHDHNRGLKTAIATLLMGVGFAVFLTGISLVSNIPITRKNGLIWGVCGFFAVALAPAIGLPPELPAMPVADLYSRQIWWVGTILVTAFALYLLAARPETWAKIAAIVLIALPHIIGAPVAADLTTLVPAPLATSFVANALGAAAIFWCVLGSLLGYAHDKYQKDIAAL
jgi:cobalt transporter subunit CbtA